MACLFQAIAACFKRCKDYFMADVGHVRRRGSVVGSRRRGRARRREGTPRSAVGDKERERETRRAQNGTERVNGVLFNCLATYTGMSYILWASRRPCGTYKAGRWLCAPSDSELGTRNSELRVRDSEFLSVVRSTEDRLREACRTL